jgi:hypothetical protein
VRRQVGCLVSAVLTLVATVLPWSSTAAATRSGWETASLGFALDEAVDEPFLAGLAQLWLAVPLAAALALCVSILLPRRPAVLAVRALGALILLDVVAVLVALHLTGLDVALVGPLLALAGGVALLTLPAPFRYFSSRRRTGAASTGAQS